MHSTSGAIPVARGCGRRVAGGIYAEVGVGPGGSPLEDFLCDPPIPVDKLRMGIASVGTAIVERDGVAHVVDVVGREHYPNVADFLEEVRRFGVSRRLSLLTEFERLSSRSKLILVHDRGYVVNYGEYQFPNDPDAFAGCPCDHVHHPTPTEMCCGVWWEDVDDGIPVDESRPRLVRRPMPWGQYTAKLAPDGVDAAYRAAIVASFPIGRLVVVRDPEGRTHERAVDRVEGAGLPITVVEE